ncbi:MAG: hypothetical protein DME74_08680 [Verrucomicrobia bacterium]|nr:MAG: hypothetical protein DME74_08680 [Verrucomicrobiota bacterium]
MVTEWFYLSTQPSTIKEKLMLIKNFVLRAAGASLAAVVLLTVQPLRAQSSSDSARLEKLERAVELLEKQNAQLQAEIKSLKKETACVCAAAWLGIEIGAGRIRPDEFRRR